MTTNIQQIDVKELKQKLTSKREERLKHIVQLGEELYKHSLSKQTEPLDYQSFVASILQCDKEIYRASSTIARESTNPESCPSCQQKNPSNVKFCGSCGTLNPLFVEQQMEKKSCATCEEVIPADFAFCPCCGIKQEAIE